VNPKLYESCPIEQLNLPARVSNALTRQGYKTIGQILDLTLRDILDMRDMGLGALSDLVRLAERADRLAQLEEELRKVREDLDGVMRTVYGAE
jgi:DNA-directed RNA polymerase alpha subunit